MTRINAGVHPNELSDKHLLAEHREIKRIPNMVKSGKAKIENIPEKFTLGKGHVKFFYNKLKWLFDRYELIYDECIKRGFNVTHYHNAWLWSNQEEWDLIAQNYKPWIETKEERERIRQLILDRIKERTLGK